MQFFQASPWRDPRFFSCSAGLWSWYLRCFLLSGSWTPVSLGCFSPYHPYVPDKLPLFVRIRSNRTSDFIIHSSVTCLTKFLIHYLRYLYDCLCSTVFFLQYTIWMFPAPHEDQGLQTWVFFRLAEEALSSSHWSDSLWQTSPTMLPGLSSNSDP